LRCVGYTLGLSHFVITGAAGFIGSHLADRLLGGGHTVTGIDNFVRGTEENLRAAVSNGSFRVVKADLSTEGGARDAFDAAFQREGVDMVWHMAANSDIPAGTAAPEVDLRDTFLTTFHVLGAMRRLNVARFAFASSSAVYGMHSHELSEDTGPLLPISNYGAMKLASEAIVSAAVDGFLSHAYIFRFPNVVGSRATHGILFDLIRKLHPSKRELVVLGDGTQQKPYLHVTDLLDAMLLIVERQRERIDCFNIAGTDAGCTVKEIAELVVRTVSPGAIIRYSGGDRGWMGDVPRFQYATGKLAKLGWRARLSSREAVEQAIGELRSELCGELDPCSS
jgi:UDP-glucose 4-epimerase